MTTQNTLPRLTGFILEDQTELTLQDVCRACAAQVDLVIELVQEGVLTPSGSAPAQWRFTGVHMHRATVALRLQRDLGVNLAGAALALELMDEMDELRAQLHRMTGT
ncbi:chaperone modulator CbpM [Polaromonas sp.]|uniref:chaperone modulator CbpM n=1 Tax=Polaromonas sp. TaxID=1869339 RepID=UPI003BAAA0E7